MTCTITSYAQDCERNLLEAKRAYLNGNFEYVIDLLTSCNGQYKFSSDRQESLELLINSKLMVDENKGADSLMYDLLSAFPLYEPRNSDLIEFKQIFNSYEIRKQFSLSTMVGINNSKFSVMQYRSYASITEEPTQYESKTEPVFGMTGAWYLNKNLFLSAGIMYQQSSYNQKETLLGFQELFVSEKLAMIKIPLQVGTQIEFKNYSLFMQGGMSVDYLISSEADIELFGKQPENTTTLTGLSRKTSNYDLSDQRRSTTYNYTIGAGIRRNINLFAIEFSAQYEFGLNNLADTQMRYQDKELLHTYSYVSDDFKMDNLQFKIAVIRYFVQPKKRSI